MTDGGGPIDSPEGLEVRRLAKLKLARILRDCDWRAVHWFLFSQVGFIVQQYILSCYKNAACGVLVNCWTRGATSS